MSDIEEHYAARIDELEAEVAWVRAELDSGKAQIAQLLHDQQPSAMRAELTRLREDNERLRRQDVMEAKLAAANAQLQKCRLVAEDTCIVEDEARRYILGFTAHLSGAAPAPTPVNVLSREWRREQGLASINRTEAEQRVLPPFKRAWDRKRSEGYQYGREALEQVRFGYEIAEAELARRKGKL